MTINLIDVARFYKNLDHQNKALIFLQMNIPRDVLEKFAELYRNDKASLFNKAALFISEYEGFEAKAYPDPLHGWKVATIGFGTTIYSDGKPVKQGDVISKDVAIKELKSYLEKMVTVLSSRIPTWGIMNDNQKIAVMSFAYNLGTHFYGNSGFKTITEYLSDTKKWPGIASAFKLYVNPGSSVEAGLRRRRLAEAELFLA